MIRRVLALAGHAVHTNLLTPFTWTGAVLLLGVSLLGPAISLRNEGVWAFDPEMLGTGYAFGALFVIRSGLVEQRMGGLQDFLRVNFVTPVEQVTAAVLGLLATWVLYAGCALLIALVLSLGDLGLAAWTVWLLFLTTGILLPFALMVECVSDLRTPLFVPGFVYFAAMFALAAALGYQRMAALLGLTADRAWPPSSLPLAARAALSLAAGFALVLVLTWTAGRGRARRVREAAG
ncbi:MAG TPA: hypothetical protein VMM12_06820 [Longimicrobiales bacterium]|nr:hypothetical protein [Longimicrobiales bacterium]